MPPLHRVKVLVGVSASVAAIRVPLLVRCLTTAGAEVRVIITASATHFLERESALPPNVTCYTDADEWSTWNTLSDPVLHIELRRWADVLLIAPTSANTLAKLAAGLCDNLLTCVARAWPLTGEHTKPFLVAPAMNTHMWHHPVTASHIQSITSFGIIHVPPIVSKLACGDTGTGAMEKPDQLLSAVISAISQHPKTES